MKCIVCRLCQSLNEALSRKFERDLWERTNYRDVWTREQDKERLRHARALEENNPVEACREFNEMAEGGSAWAMQELGWAYRTGAGVSCDLAASIYWYDRAVAAGSDWALFGLGEAYLAAGELKKAERVYRIGIARDLPQAMTGMARVCMKRSAGAPDWEEARALLERAIALGDLQAKQCLARLLIRGRFGLRAIPAGFRLARGLYDDVAPLLQDPALGNSGAMPDNRESLPAARLSTT